MNIKNKLQKNIILNYWYVFIERLNMQSSIWVLYLAHCGMNLAQIGLLEGVYHVTSMFFEIPSGALADLLGRKRSLILGRICIAVSCMIMLCSKSFWLFALSFFMQALGNNFNSGSQEALVYDSMKAVGVEESYIRVNGRVNVIIEVSQGIATVAGGILAEYSYVWCYAASLVIALLAFLPILWMTEAPYAEEKETHTKIKDLIVDHFVTCFRILKNDLRILRLVAYFAVIFAAQTLLFFYSQQYFYDLGYNKIGISVIMLIFSICSCLGALCSDKLYERFGDVLMHGASLLIALSILCFGFQNAVIAVIALSVSGFLVSLLYPIESSLLNSMIPSEQRATLISVDSMFFSIGMILMFPIAGVLADSIGLRMVFAGLGAVLVVFVIVDGRKKRA